MLVKAENTNNQPATAHGQNSEVKPRGEELDRACFRSSKVLARGGEERPLPGVHGKTQTISNPYPTQYIKVVTTLGVDTAYKIVKQKLPRGKGPKTMFKELKLPTK